MKYKVFHNELSTFDTELTAYRPNPTIIVEANSLEEVFRLTNHIDRPFFDNPEVTVCVRSTSVGDVIEDEDGNRFVVAPIGFEESPPQATPEVIITGLHDILQRRSFPQEHLPVLTMAYGLLLTRWLQEANDAT